MDLTEKILKSQSKILEAANKKAVFLIEFDKREVSNIALDILLKTLKNNNLSNKVFILVNRIRTEYPEFEAILDKEIEEIQHFISLNKMNAEIKQIELSPQRRFFTLLIGKGCLFPKKDNLWCNKELKLNNVKEFEEEIKKLYKGDFLVKIVTDKPSDNSNEFYRLLIAEDFTLKDIWEYVEYELSFNKETLIQMNHNLFHDFRITEPVCWFCPVRENNITLNNKYSDLERYKAFLRDYSLKDDIYYLLDKTLKIEIREFLFRELLKTLKEKDIDYFLPFEEVIEIQREHIKEGWFSLNILKEYNNFVCNKDIEKIIKNIDSIEVLFPRIKEILNLDFFKDIKASVVIEGLVRRILLGDKFSYSYIIKEIKTPVEELNIPSSLKEDFLNIEKQRNIRIPNQNNFLNLTLKIIHNYYYYLHKFQ